MTAAMGDRCPDCGHVADCCGNCGCDPERVDLLAALQGAVESARLARRKVVQP